MTSEMKGLVMCRIIYSEIYSETESIVDLENLPDQYTERDELAAKHLGVVNFLFGDNEDIVAELKKLPLTKNPGHMDARI